MAAYNYNTDMDYAKELQKAMAEGQSAEYVQHLLDGRKNKIETLGGDYTKYQNDELMGEAVNYIKKNSPGYTSYNSFSDYAADSGLTDYTSAMKNETAAAKYQNELAAQQNVIAAEKAADEAGRANYVTYMQSKQNLPQQLAASGINGGTADTYNLLLETAMQNANNSTQSQKNNAIANANSQLAAQNSQIDQNAYTNLMSYLQGLSGEYANYNNAMNQIKQNDFQWRTEQNKNDYWNAVAQSNEEWAQKYQEDNAKFSQMMDLWELYGYATPEIAKYLGVPQGAQHSVFVTNIAKA